MKCNDIEQHDNGMILFLFLFFFFCFIYGEGGWVAQNIQNITKYSICICSISTQKILVFLFKATEWLLTYVRIYMNNRIAIGREEERERERCLDLGQLTSFVTKPACLKLNRA